MTLAVPLAACAAPSPPPLAASICNRHDVASFAAQHFRAENAYARQVPTLVGESPTTAPNTLLCMMPMEVSTYSIASPAPVVATQPTQRFFYVTKLAEGFRVEFPPPGQPGL